MSTSITISITQSCTWSRASYTKQILNIHVLLIHVSETYNTIMSLHALGISTSISTKTKDCATRTLLKTGGELRFSGKVSSSCSTCATRRVAFWQAQLLRRWFQSRYPPEMLKFSNINPGPGVSHVSLIYLVALSSPIQSGSFYTEKFLK
jgi:hypothetical protein